MFFKGRKKQISERGSNKDCIVYKEELVESLLQLTSKSIKSLLENNSDVVFRELYINGLEEMKVTLIFIEGLIDLKNVDDDILKPLTQEISLTSSKNVNKVIEKIEHGTLYHVSQKTRIEIYECVNDIIDGSVALVFDQVKKAVTFDVRGFDKRRISEPTGENVFKGAKDSFVENLRTNTATVRRKIKTHKLVIEETKVGKQSLTKVAIVYIEGITNMNMVQQLKQRLDKISTDGVLSVGIIEENLIDNKYSPFPQIIYTERPDKFCANVVEGRVGVIIDELPLTYIVPGTFESFLQAPEDYSQHFVVSSVIRFLRFALIFVTLLLPGFYVSVTTFHHEMIPTGLALAITASKEGVPFPSFVEVIFMLIAFEILIEAGLRLPKAIGQAVSIVGAVVVGQAAVEARLVSPSVVVVIAITAISSFAMANQDFSNALRLWRLAFVILSSGLGLYGLSLGGIILLNHLSKMEVYGIPYMSPFVGEENKEMQDSLFRFPFSAQYKRPTGLKTTNKKRQGN